MKVKLGGYLDFWVPRARIRTGAIFESAASFPWFLTFFFFVKVVVKLVIGKVDVIEGMKVNECDEKSPCWTNNGFEPWNCHRNFGKL